MTYLSTAPVVGLAWFHLQLVSLLKSIVSSSDPLVFFLILKSYLVLKI
jgi:hypothetical protein